MTEGEKQRLDDLRAAVDHALDLADAQANALVAAKLADVVDTIDGQQRPAV